MTATARQESGFNRTAKAKSIIDADTGLAVQLWPARTKSDSLPWLLIHGLFGSSASWNNIAARLSESGNDVYAIDLPGHGRSTAQEIVPTEIAKAICLTMRKLHQGPLRVAGISMGALFGAELAVIDEKLSSLHLLCPAGLGKDSNKQFIFAMLDAIEGASIDTALTFLGTAASKLGDKAYVKLQSELRANGKALTRMANAWFPNGEQAFLIHQALSQISVPINVLFGLEDKIVPLQHASSLPEHVALHFLPDAGHMPHWDRPGEVITFLKS